MSIALIVSFVVFFFKQKTAYEMRISDWSSDVCSSDLIEVMRVTQLAGELRRAGVGADVEHPVLHRRRHHGHRQVRPDDAGRSEEHTSELQSLMRISYAVFCLKKKKQKKRI